MSRGDDYCSKLSLHSQHTLCWLAVSTKNRSEATIIIDALLLRSSFPSFAPRRSLSVMLSFLHLTLFTNNNRYVWLINSEEAGRFALLSIVVSALTTGFTSAMIAFDMDVDVPHRKSQPRFYGYIPDDNGQRGRCFMLMTLISTLHNLSRSVGCALLLVLPNKSIILYIMGGEMTLYLTVKVLRNDFFYWARFDKSLEHILSFFEWVLVKIIVDFSGCLHFRHPVSNERAKLTKVSIFGTFVKHRNFVAKTVPYGAVLCTRGRGESSRCNEPDRRAFHALVTRYDHPKFAK